MPGAEQLFFPRFVDDRGALVAVEFRDVPFPVARIFTVRGADGGVERGNHLVNGTQLLVLQSGTVEVRLGSSASDLGDPQTLDRPGAALLIPHDRFIRYRLPDAGSSILALCEREYVPRE